MAPLKTKKLTTKHLTIDIHAHCRGEEQSDEATIAGVLDLASKQGVGKICDMPNCHRPVVSRERVYERLALVPKGQEDRYKLYVGLTGEIEQLYEALWCHNHIPQVIGFKMFAGRSVGDLSVISEDDQRRVYRELVKLSYREVIAVHCEKESQLKPDLWNPALPITHCWARPEMAEVESVADQIKFALEERFWGQLHICHVSSPESVCRINEAKKLGLNISCGVTPHHIMWDESKMRLPEGMIYKMNPPLRSLKSVLKLREQLMDGMIDVIETDHAPHTSEKKQSPQCLSGYPSLNLYRQFTTEFLPNLGLSEEDIRKMTLDNIIKIFGYKLGEKEGG